MKLTIKESNSLKAITKNALDQMGGKQPKDLFEDNFSWFDREDISKETGYSRNEAAGIMAALEKKGLIVKDDNDWCLTDKGIEIAQLDFIRL